MPPSSLHGSWVFLLVVSISANWHLDTIPPPVTPNFFWQLYVTDGKWRRRGDKEIGELSGSFSNLEIQTRNSSFQSHVFAMFFALGELLSPSCSEGRPIPGLTHFYSFPLPFITILLPNLEARRKLSKLGARYTFGYAKTLVLPSTLPIVLSDIGTS